MEKKYLLWSIVAATILLFLMVSVMYYNKKYIGSEEKINWKWQDDWGGSLKDTMKKEENKAIPSSYENALQISKQTGKNIFVFFEANWCNWCQKMKKDVLSDPKVQDSLESCIVVFVDVDNNKEIARKYGIRQIPSYLVINSNEQKLKAGDKYKDVNLFLEWLNNNRDKSSGGG